MKKTSLALVSALLFGLSGCIPTSLNPLTGQDLVFDPALIGVWRGEGDAKETWAFEKAGDKEYKFVYTEEDGKTGQFEARLLKLGNAQFLDFFPDESGIEEMNRSGFYKVHLLRTHSFLKVTQIEPALQMAPLDLKWLREFLGKNPKAVRHHEVGEGDDAQIVLTDSTPELRKFVENHLKTAGAFGEPIHLKRTRNQVAEVSELRPSRRHQRMNGSKRCGPSGDERTSREAPTRFAQRASPFPSPPPSPSGRGRILRCLSAQPSAERARRTSRATEAVADCSLSPWERVRVRGIGLGFDSTPRTIPKIVELGESSGRAGGFPRRL